MNAPLEAGIVLQLGTCTHPSAESVIGLTNEWLWCSRCGAVRKVDQARWALPALASTAVRLRGGT